MLGKRSFRSETSRTRITCERPVLLVFSVDVRGEATAVATFPRTVRTVERDGGLLLALRRLLF